MRKFIIAVAVASVITAGVQTSIFANADMQQPCKKGHHAHHKKHMENFAKKLNLTEDQKVKINAIKDQAKSQIKPIFVEMKAEKSKYMEMKKAKASEQELQAQKQKVMELKKKMREIHKQNLAGFEKILTPEQKVQFETIKKEKMEKFKQKRAEWQKKRLENNKT